MTNKKHKKTLFHKKPANSHKITVKKLRISLVIE